jgi:hypothetical protein
MKYIVWTAFYLQYSLSPRCLKLCNRRFYSEKKILPKGFNIKWILWCCNWCTGLNWIGIDLHLFHTWFMQNAFIFFNSSSYVTIKLQCSSWALYQGMGIIILCQVLRTRIEPSSPMLSPVIESTLVNWNQIWLIEAELANCVQSNQLIRYNSLSLKTLTVWNQASSNLVWLIMAEATNQIESI